MPPATRVYVLLLLVTTAVDVSVGKVIDSAATFSLDWGKTFKVPDELLATGNVSRSFVRCVPSMMLHAP